MKKIWINKHRRLALEQIAERIGFEQLKKLTYKSTNWLTFYLYIDSIWFHGRFIHTLEWTKKGSKKQSIEVHYDTIEDEMAKIENLYN